MGPSRGASLYADSSIIIHTTHKTSAPQTNKLLLQFTASNEGNCLNASVSVRPDMAVNIGIHIMNDEKESVDILGCIKLFGVINST